MGSLQKLQITITVIGLFFLGCFFGFLTSLAVDLSSNVNLKVISALSCAALAGGLVLLMAWVSLRKMDVSDRLSCRISFGKNRPG